MSTRAWFKEFEREEARKEDRLDEIRRDSHRDCNKSMVCLGMGRCTNPPTACLGCEGVLPEEWVVPLCDDCLEEQVAEQSREDKEER